MTPGRKLLTTTSMAGTSRWTTSRPSGRLRSTARLSLFRLSPTYGRLSPSRNGPNVRVRSPWPGRSTLMTVAPWSARIAVHEGPKITCVKSRTRTPSSAPPRRRLSLAARLRPPDRLPLRRERPGAFHEVLGFPERGLERIGARPSLRDDPRQLLERRLLGGLDRQGSALQDLRRPPLGAGHELGPRDHLVHQPDALRLRGADELPRQQEAHRDLERHDPREPLGAGVRHLPASVARGRRTARPPPRRRCRSRARVPCRRPRRTR